MDVHHFIYAGLKKCHKYDLNKSACTLDLADYCYYTISIFAGNSNDLQYALHSQITDNIITL